MDAWQRDRVRNR